MNAARKMWHAGLSSRYAADHAHVTRGDPERARDLGAVAIIEARHHDILLQRAARSLQQAHEALGLFTAKR